MEIDSAQKLNIAKVLWETLRTYRAQARGLLGIGLVTAIAGSIVGGAAVWSIAGYSANPNGIDPTMMAYTMTTAQWAAAGIALLLLIVLLSFAGAASILMAWATPGTLTVHGAFAGVRAAPLQLFWLIWIVVILSSQFSPLAAPLLWFLIAPAIPLACVLALGPTEAVDRMWTLSQGSRVRLLILEVLLCALFPVVVILTRKHILFSGRSFIDFDRYPTPVRLPFVVLATWLAATAAQAVLVGLTCAYRALQGPRLHARTANSVN